MLPVSLSYLNCAVAVATPCCYESWGSSFMGISPRSGRLFVFPGVHKTIESVLRSAWQTLSSLALPLCSSFPPKFLSPLRSIHLRFLVIVGWGMCTPWCSCGGQRSALWSRFSPETQPVSLAWEVPSPTGAILPVPYAPFLPYVSFLLGGKAQVCLWFSMLVHQLYLNCLMVSLLSSCRS